MTNVAQTIQNPKVILPSWKVVCFYLFVGVFIGDLAICSYFLISRGQLSPADINSFFQLLVIGYPVGLIVAGIPAVLSALLIESNQPTRNRYLTAFSIGFIVCLLFNTAFSSGFTSIGFAVIGGIAALSCRYLIYRKQK